MKCAFRARGTKVARLESKLADAFGCAHHNLPSFVQESNAKKILGQQHGNFNSCKFGIALMQCIVPSPKLPVCVDSADQLVLCRVNEGSAALPTHSQQRYAFDIEDCSRKGARSERRFTICFVLLSCHVSYE